MSKEKIKDVLVRAGKTFVQGAIAAIPIDTFIGVTDIGLLKKIALMALVGATAAGVSAVWNLFVGWLSEKLDEMIPTEDELTEALEGGDDYGEN